MNDAAKHRDLKLLINSPSSSLAQTCCRSRPGVYSPVTDLTMSFTGLITDGKKAYVKRLSDTPKRRLSLNSTLECSPHHPSKDLRPITIGKQISNDDGCCMDSPSSPIDSEPYFKRGSYEIQSNAESALEFKSEAFRRFKSLPKPFAELDNSPIKSESLVLSPSSSPTFHLLLSQEHTPERASRVLFSDHLDSSRLQSPANKTTLSLHDDEESSQDSGLGLDKAQSPFAKPQGPAPRRTRVLGDSTNSPKHRRSSTPEFTQHFRKNLANSESPVKLRKSSLTYSPEADDGDDGFLELFDGEETYMPKGMEGLLKKPLLPLMDADRSCDSIILEQNEFTPGLRHDNQENIRPKPLAGSRRGLFRSPSTPNITSTMMMSPMFKNVFRPKTKRCEDEELAPILKRRKSACFGTPEKMFNLKIFQRSHSTNDDIIRTLDNVDASSVIGDLSKPYCLPSIPGKHSDLKCISPDTLARLLRGEFDDKIESYTIIDNRYPYEFDGGHIMNAINIYEKDTMMEFFNCSEQHKPTSDNKRRVLIFHCEFSSERGPKMSRFLRKMDRERNTYPSLNYPELYLLEGGYKAFYYKYMELCCPQMYKPMSHEDHLDDLRHFRAKSKSWAGEKAPKPCRISRQHLKL